MPVESREAGGGGSLIRAENIQRRRIGFGAYAAGDWQSRTAYCEFIPHSALDDPQPTTGILSPSRRGAVVDDCGQAGYPPGVTLWIMRLPSRRLDSSAS